MAIYDETAQNSDGIAMAQALPRGRPFRKGVSGNPGGRPKVVAEVRDLARAHTGTALATLVDICRNGESESARVAAACALLDRGWGKPAVPIVAEVPTRITLNFNRTLNFDRLQAPVVDGEAAPWRE